MTVTLQTALDMILGITPVPGLSLAFSSLKVIISAVQQASMACKQRLRVAVLAQSAAQLLQTLNTEFSSSRLMQSACGQPLNDLHSLLTEIESFVQKEETRRFFKSLLTQDERLERIDGFHRRLGSVADAFQISALCVLLQEQRIRVSQLGNAQHDAQSVPPSRPAVSGNTVWAVAPSYQLAYLSGGQPSGSQSHRWVADQPAVQGPNSNSQPVPRRQRILLYPRRQTEYYGFSSYSPHPVIYNCKAYPTSEHLFQAFRFMDNHPNIADSVRTAKHPEKMSRAHIVHQHPNWESMKISRIELAMWHKFLQYPELKMILLAPCDAELIYSTTGDFWGVGKDGNGRNEYGKMLERLRSIISAQDAATSISAPQPPAHQRIYVYPYRKDQYHGLSTRSPHPVEYNGKLYPTCEHLFQAFKFMDNRPDIAESVRTVSNGSPLTFSEAHVEHQRSDWERIRVSKMEIAVWHKLSQHPELKRILLQTKDAELLHFTTGGFWGVGRDDNGRNEYGKLLERVRASLRET
ncbi:hypothetical protein C8R47DRAFT_1091704 [Mycena vitilis]|nr:hypothetical protein C8R47DRAFT_1091704 [Mycena vitilis]